MAKKTNEGTPQPTTRRLCFYCGGKKCVHCYDTGITVNDLTEDEKNAGRKRLADLAAQAATPPSTE